MTVLEYPLGTASSAPVPGRLAPRGCLLVLTTARGERIAIRVPGTCTVNSTGKTEGATATVSKTCSAVTSECEPQF